MSPHGEEPPPRGSSAKTTSLQQKVAQFYYSHGLFCSSYPTSVISVGIIIALLCCYPLINLPLPGSLPMQHWVTYPNYSSSGQYVEKPWCYIQQVVLRTAVVPWPDDMFLGDAFRAPLYEAFKLLDTVRNYQDDLSSRTLGHICLHVEAIKKRNTGKNKNKNVLPEYSCLVLSPANFWSQDAQAFVQDTSIISTIYSQQSFQKGKTSIAEMLFGMHVSDTGIKRYPLRRRRRILQYAVTLFFKEYDEQFISGLRHKLHTLYPLHQNMNYSYVDSSFASLNNTVIIQYPGEINYYEFIPLIFAFLLLFFYYYFSVRKIELIKSKFGMAFTVVVTVFGSLSMTLGLCFFFGLTLSMQGKEIFPYLVILVGLENVLVLTKSVVSTPGHLDIKIRVSQGLSKEGWSITKNLLIEITILTVGIFTFVPAIQEFCIFSVVGLITDFFLQMMFFTTILGIDTRRMENMAGLNPNFRSSLYQNPIFDRSSSVPAKGGMIRSKSHPRLNLVHTNVIAGQTQSAQEKKIPKRLRLVNIWARTRFFQRAFMVLMVVWISMILYNTGLIKSYFLELNISKSLEGDDNIREGGMNSSSMVQSLSPTAFNKRNNSYIVNLELEHTPYLYLQNHTNELSKLKHPDFSPLLKLSTQHWPSILGKYNISISGQQITILPAIRISHAIHPEQAILLRNPYEKMSGQFQWHSLAAALDPIDFTDLEGGPSLANFHQSERPLYPTSPMELILIAILCFISVIVLAYATVVLYRCVCSRNYAEWRASWTSEKTEEADTAPVMLEAIPIVVEGNLQEIECLATDGSSIVSSCLGGQLKVWDSVTGELLSCIDRNTYFSKQETPMYYDDNLSDYESGSPPSRDGSFLMFPSLKDKINLNFSNLKMEPASNDSKFEFGEQYRQLYLNCNKKPRARSRSKDTVKWVRHQRNISKLEQDDDCECVKSCDTHKTQSCKNLSDNCDIADSSSGMCNSSSQCNNSGVSIGQAYKASPIWCMDYLDNLIVIGCADGRLEIWEGTTGKFKYLLEDSNDVGVTSIKIIRSRVIVARLYGTIDLFELQSYSQGRPIDWNFSCAYRRTHVRSGSTGSISDCKLYTTQNDSKEDVRCFKVLSTKAHQQPITCLDCEGGKILSGSQDHTLKVFRLEDGSPLYTLHGHCGPITCLFIDRISPGTSGSGSQDGMLCVWDLLTGTCMYSIQAHDGSVTALTYSASYVISLGADERLCVWERFQGHLLNTIYMNQSFTSQVLMLTSHLVVTARPGSLVIYDVRTGETVHNIILGQSPFVFVKQLIMLRDAILCDYGKQLRIVRFPLIARKYD